jgi:hypothetical protein
MTKQRNLNVNDYPAGGADDSNVANLRELDAVFYWATEILAGIDVIVQSLDWLDHPCVNDKDQQPGAILQRAVDLLGKRLPPEMPDPNWTRVERLVLAAVTRITPVTWAGKAYTTALMSVLGTGQLMLASWIDTAEEHGEVADRAAQYAAFLRSFSDLGPAAIQAKTVELKLEWIATRKQLVPGLTPEDAMLDMVEIARSYRLPPYGQYIIQALLENKAPLKQEDLIAKALGIDGCDGGVRKGLCAEMVRWQLLMSGRDGYWPTPFGLALYKAERFTTELRRPAALDNG